MKRITAAFLFAISLLLVTSTLFAQERKAPPKTYTIKVIVDTDKVTKKNLDHCGIVTMEFDTLSVTGPALKDFEIPVEPGKVTITWEGMAKNDQDEVEIVQIRRKPAYPPIYFRTQKILNQWAYGTNSATTKGNNKDGDHQKYSVQFQIKGKDEKYRIDPKLRVYRTRKLAGS